MDPQIPATPPPTTAMPVPPATAPMTTPQAGTLNTSVTWRRVFAILVDSILIGILFSVLTHFFGTTTHVGSTSTNLATQSTLSGIPSMVFSVVTILYFIIMEWQVGGTLGKMILGIKVTDLNGNKISFGSAFLRNLLRIVDAFPYVIPYLTGLIVVLTSSQKQRVGDKVAKTLVIRKVK